jgi:hypothetical protein
VAESLHNLLSWTKGRIDTECTVAYRRYERALQDHYTAYFARYPHLRSFGHQYSAHSLAGALPPGYADLQRLIPKRAQHRFIRSARSSQGLALALLGVAAKIDPSLKWFWDALQLPFRVDTSRPSSCSFEFPLDKTDLNEQPRTSQLDFLVRHRSICVSAEIKWSENGLGSCSCFREAEGSPLPGDHCAARVYDRAAYWAVAQEVFALPAERSHVLPCPISPVYQVVRNVAAVRHLAGKSRPAVFVLLYDARNPFFCRTGEWPGWPAILSSVLNDSESTQFWFRAVSWQHLIAQLPLPASVRRWAQVKHQL